MSQIKERIREYILKEYAEGETDRILDDSPLLSSGIIDSISALQLVDFLEKEFGIEFEAHEVDQENINTLNRITEFVEAKKAK